MNKPKKQKRKINKLNLWAIIVSSIAIFAFICLLFGSVVILNLLKNKPIMDLQDFEQSESSIIYDDKEHEIADLGNVIRRNVEYDELPNCVIDAFVAVEDSRFFEHNGFDLPRFTKAIIENIIAMDFAQGGSTFTMQLVKNTYYTNDDTGEEASRSGVGGVKRKVQEIALAFELEKYQTKQFIFVSYLNKLNFGGNRNIRGIQKAAQYYFSKDVSELNLNEAALLAGVINAPNYYNPFNNLDAAQQRVGQVLYQMYNHGYISKAEYELAKTVRVEDLLTDPYESSKEGEGIAYQAYVDAVVNEVIKLTGLDPYTTTMHIHTYMNSDIQAIMDDIQAEKIYYDEDGNWTNDDTIEVDEDGELIEKKSYLKYPDEFMEVASVCIDNYTGQVVGILGGRNYSGGGQLLLNHATEQYKQPGSSIKPILDYALAFENLGWATDHVLTDRPMYMDSSHNNLVYNFSGKYVGDVTLKTALGDSINTCAFQALQAVIDKMKYEYVVNYCQSLGYNFSLDDFNIQYSVGGSTCEVTPYQHAAAYAAIMNYGTYNTPHTVKRIEFTNGKSPVTPVYESKQVISEAAAYLTTDLMKSNVQSFGGSYAYLKNSDYTVYAKTGTTDWGREGKQFGIPSGANKDCWLVASTTEYTTATWIGYEKAVLDQPSYISDDIYYNVRPQARIGQIILDACYKYGDTKPSVLTQPSGVTSVTHILGTWPYASTNIEGVQLDESLISTGLVKKDLVKVVSLSAPTIEASPAGSEATLADTDTSTAIIKLNFKKYPDENATKVVEKTRDQSLKTSGGEVIIASEGAVLFDYSWVYGPVQYCADVDVVYADGTSKKFQYSDSEDKAQLEIGNLLDGGTVTANLYYKYGNSNVQSDVLTVKADVDETDINIILPGKGVNTKEALETWCSAYDGCSVKVDSSGAKPDGTVIIDIDGNIFTNDGSTHTIKKSAKIEVTLYMISYSLELNVSSSSNNSLYITATTNDTNVSWKIPNTAYFTITQINDKKLEVSVKATPSEGSASITIGATSDHISVKKEVTIYVDSAGNLTY